MRVLVACEFSGRVRDAFRAMGHDAWSCDLLPTDRGPEFHIQGDVREHLEDGWDMMIAHPPCRYLAISGRAWFAKRQKEQRAALDFVRLLMATKIHRVAIENPISVISTQIQPPSQIIQPWWFGHGEVKATCLWLKRLPYLRPTKIVDGRNERIMQYAPAADRWRERSRTLPGIAAAMAQQWGGLE